MLCGRCRSIGSSCSSTDTDAHPADDDGIADDDEESPGDWHDESNDPALAEDGDSDRSNA